MDRRRFIGLMGRSVAAAGICAPLACATRARAAAVPADADARGLAGEYGFLSAAVLAAQPEEAVRARVATMVRDYGVREFQFYDWFADYSTAVTGDHWTDPFLHRMPISRRSIEISIDEIHRQGARAWAYVQTVGSEEQGLEDPGKDLWKLRDGKGQWCWYPPAPDKPRFPTYFANAAWARHMVERWAGPVRALAFDGIHWDTLGRLAGDYGAETAGMHAFIETAHGLLSGLGLRQTMNFVDLAWWDRGIVRAHLEFPYAETWSPEVAARYFHEMDQPDMAGVRGVQAMYPTVAVPPGQTAAQVICERRRVARQHRVAYLIVGDGARRMKTEYWPDTEALSEAESACLRDGVPASREE